MKGGSVLAYGGILAIFLISSFTIIYITSGYEPVKRNIISVEGRIILFGDDVNLLIKNFDASIEFISQRSAYDLGEVGGINASEVATWNSTYPSLNDLELALESAIKENLPQGMTQDDITITWGDASINVSGYDTTCGPIENSKCFEIDGNKSFSIYDKSIDSRITLNPYSFSQNISSNYFRLLNAGRVIFDDSTFNSLFNDVGALLNALNAAKASDPRFKDLNFSIKPIITTPVDEAFHSLGDVNRDGIINMYDALKLGLAFGSTCTEATCPTGHSCWGDWNGCTYSPTWNPDADLNKDGVINQTDADIITANYEKIFPVINLFEMTIEDKCYPPSTYCIAPLKPGETGEISGIPYDYLKLKFRFNANIGSTPLILTCSDGTSYDSCSSNKPKYCNSVTLIDKCSQCGCPNPSDSCNADGTCTSCQCSDGTSCNSCSSTKPLYCKSDKTLVNDCNTCGCPSPTDTCNADGSCSAPQLFTFSVSVNPSSDTIIQGASFSQTVTITITRISGTPRLVSLSIAGSIPGIIISSPSPLSCTPSAPSYACTSAFTLSGPPTTPGTYQITITGIGGGGASIPPDIESATYTLTVNPSSAPTCTDTDSTDKTVQGTCTDGTGSHTDYCIDNTHICEYVCPGASAFPSCICMADTTCPVTSPFCSNGACVSAYTLTFKAQVDITGAVLPGVQVNVDGIINTTQADGTTTYLLTPGILHGIMIQPQSGSRFYSHLWDSDCDPSNLNWYLDTPGLLAGGFYQSSFMMYNRNRNITAQYKTFTMITNTTETPNTFEFDGTNIKGKLLDENNNSIIAGPGVYHLICGASASSRDINRNVTLEYYNGSWNYIGVNDSLSDGSWSYSWNCVSGATKLRVNYTPTSMNWYYTPNSTEIPINCVPTYELTFDAKADVAGISLPSNIATVDSQSGTATFMLSPGSHTISVPATLTGGGSYFVQRDFSHFWDHNCSANSGNWSDSSPNPLTFQMFNNKSITAQYKTTTSISGLSYSSNMISGALLDENSNPIIQVGHYHPACTAPNDNVEIPIDRKVVLEYYNGSWNPIDTTKFYDDFNDGDYTKNWAVTGTWGVLNGELNNSGVGDESIQTYWNQWNNDDFASVNIKLLSGNDVLVSIRNDSDFYYYIQTRDGYKTLHLWIKNETGTYDIKDVDISSLSINPNAWNNWRIEQNAENMLFYINNNLLINTTTDIINNYFITKVPKIINGKIRLRTLNTQALFDDVNVDGIIYNKDGSWLYPWSCEPLSSKIRASYNPSNWFYMSSSSQTSITCNNGALEVHVFSSGSEVNTNVALRLGDVNWDGIVDKTDKDILTAAWHSLPGDSNWNVDCDMRIDNSIDVNDAIVIGDNINKTVPIKTSPFKISLPANTYQLRTKYNNQVKNNESVVITAGQTTRVNFNFP